MRHRAREAALEISTRTQEYAIGAMPHSNCMHVCCIFQHGAPGVDPGIENVENAHRLWAVGAVIGE